MKQKYIQFKHGHEMNHDIRNFYDIAEFLGVPGTIDCTHTNFVTWMSKCRDIQE